MKITNKKYICPVCGNIENHSTNHFGEIYTSCKVCKHIGMYCLDVNQFDGQEFVNAKINFYYFNLGKPYYQDEEYTLLKNMFDGLNYTELKFESLIEYKTMQALKKHDGEIIKLYNVNQFENQIVSNIGRVFYWYEAYYVNKDIREGYYLTFAI